MDMLPFPLHMLHMCFIFLVESNCSGELGREERIGRNTNVFAFLDEKYEKKIKILLFQNLACERVVFL